MLGVDEALGEHDFFWQAIFGPWRFSTMWINCRDSSSDFVRAGIEPDVAAAESADMKLIFRPLDDPQRTMDGVELDNATAFGIIDPPCEYGRAAGLLGGVAQQCAQIVAIEDVVAEAQRQGFASEEPAADHEGFCNSAGIVPDQDSSIPI